MHRSLEEGAVEAARTQVEQLPIFVAEFVCILQYPIEEAVGLVLVERTGLLRGQTNGDRYVARLARGRDHELGTLACRKGQGNYRIDVRDALAGVAFVDHGGAELAGAFEGQRWHLDPLPTVSAFEIQLARPVDADLSDLGRGHELANPQHVVLVVEELVGDL